MAATGGQHVHVPLTDELDLRSDDFTVTAWFSYDQTAGAHTLLWAYRMGSENTPQLWLRAEPGSNRIRAHLAAEEGTPPSPRRRRSTTGAGTTWSCSAAAGGSG
ncbi:hypothetical protein ACFQ0O_26345 [Saccharopolyspora spinosporotrichia]